MIKNNEMNTYVHALYDNDYTLIKSIKIIQYHNYDIHEVYSPFPIHNLTEVLKLKKTNLSFLSFIYGLLGFCMACILTWYTMIWDWPQNIGGKPSFSWIRNFPSFIPVIFELSIFFSAHFMCITYLIQCKLFPGRISKNPDPRTTDNMFLIEIYTEKNITQLVDLLKQYGAIEVIIKK
ncbi:QuinolCytochrome C Oxidoreductase Membrane Protein [Blattabacterium sp. (Nauphoeta cinerea)]|uniref:DUF3341 domain-containing protein n=1 Tax=Blattabacterium sp. (Nauphoeta cinerea) TaxID=1316444 RepID=UPI0003B0F50A|nr:DUF3341 domain-containing protein [Blattabacterium sp. (Nauphoeta cinerea)]AGW86324.1 QuinolCytochrome C Oxidoreductase Membrane Protein [Blattabacterium sp. (Nauphoeta cinerea)]